MTLILQLLAVVILVILSGFFSGAETGVYRLSRFRLRLGIEQSRRFYKTLGRLMDQSHGLVFSILIGNNLTHYLITSLVTYMFIDALGTGSAEIYTTVLMTPILFVFAEVVPKNIYYHHCDSLMPRSAPVIWLFHVVFKYSGAVLLLTFMSKVLSSLIGKGQSQQELSAAARGHVYKMISETRDEGILSKTQTDMMRRLVDVEKLSVRSVLIKWQDVEYVDVNTNRDALLGRLKKTAHTRLPIYHGNTSNVIGYVNIFQTLTGGDDFDDLREFIHPIEDMDSDKAVIDAIDEMRARNLKIVLVRQGSSKKKRVLGIATMKDLVEELTGELSQW